MFLLAFFMKLKLQIVKTHTKTVYKPISASFHRKNKLFESLVGKVYNKIFYLPISVNISM